MLIGSNSWMSGAPSSGGPAASKGRCAPGVALLALSALLFVAAAPALAQQTQQYPNGQVYQPLRWDIEGGYSITQGAASQYLDNGWTVGGGVDWFPSPQSPLGLRLDLNYSQFDATHQLLYQSSLQAGTQINHGIGRIWGGDVDAVFDVPVGPRAHGYLLGGVGMYQRQIELTQRLLGGGYFCEPWWGVCGPGFLPYNSIVSRTTTATHFAWNAGAGVEFPLSPVTSLFIEARFMRINPADQRTELVPITVGLRF